MRYSRGITSSSPAEATARARASPSPDQSPPRGMPGSGTVDGTTVRVSVVANWRVARHRPNGSTSCTLTGPTV